MKSTEENINTQPIISIEGRMSTKDAGRAAIIMAWGKAISLVIVSISGLTGALGFLLWRILG